MDARNLAIYVACLAWVVFAATFLRGLIFIFVQGAALLLAIALTIHAAGTPGPKDRMADETFVPEK